MFDQCLYFNTSALARQLDRAWTVAFKPFSLTPPQAFLLRAVLNRPGLSPADLAESLVISRPTATRSLDGLESKGLVQRVASDRDGREFLVRPTRKAEVIKADLNEASGKVTRRLRALLGETEFSSIVSKVREVRFALK